MEIERDLLASLPRTRRSVVGIGVFDGVHLAHRRLLETVCHKARQKGVDAGVITFDPHPQEVLSEKPRPRLCSLDERIRQMDALGLDFVGAIRFDREFSSLSPQEFVDKVLVRHLHVQEVVVGFNFRFGTGGQGTPAMLKELGELNGFGVTTVGPVKVADLTVSSSAIRTALENGSIPIAAQLLGRPYAVSGVVRTGAGRGRTIGFPTANLHVDPGNRLLPKRGVYRGVAQPQTGAAFQALINIGTRPTFDEETGPTFVEVYLHGFSGDLVDSQLKVTFLERLRDERRFDTVDGLVSQIQNDLERLLSKSLQ